MRVLCGTCTLRNALHVTYLYCTAPEPPNARYKLLSTKHLIEAELKARQHHVEGCNTVPIAPAEVADCASRLLPNELHQVLVTPSSIDFGQVCLRTVCTRELVVLNNLTRFIFFELVIDQQSMRELRQTSPLTQGVLCFCLSSTSVLLMPLPLPLPLL